MASSLYRAEYLAAHAARWQGEILLARRPQFTGIAALAALAVGACIAVAAWGDAARRVSVSGLVTPLGGLLDITSRASGVVENVNVREGDVVQVGAPLFEIRTDTDVGAGSVARLLSSTIRSRRAALEDELRQRAAQHETLQRILSAKSDALTAQIDAIQREEKLLSLRIDLSRKELERVERLTIGGFISEAQRQSKLEGLLDWETRQAQIQRSAHALRAEQRQLDAERASARTQFETGTAALSRSVQATDQELVEMESRGREIVIAKRQGRVTSVQVSPGASVRSQQVLAVLSPEQDVAKGDAVLEATVFVPSRGVGFVAVGQNVWLRYAAFPYQKFGQQKGRVVQVAGSPTPIEDLPAVARASVLSARPSGEPLYRVRIAILESSPSPESRRLDVRPGMLLDADLIQERRSLLEWVFEPLLSARFRFTAQ